MKSTEKKISRQEGDCEEPPFALFSGFTDGLSMMENISREIVTKLQAVNGVQDRLYFTGDQWLCSGCCWVLFSYAGHISNKPKDQCCKPGQALSKLRETMRVFSDLTDFFPIDQIFETYSRSSPDYIVMSADFVIILFRFILSKIFQAFLDTDRTYDGMPIDIFAGKNLLQVQYRVQKRWNWEDQNFYSVPFAMIYEAQS